MVAVVLLGCVGGAGAAGSCTTFCSVSNATSLSGAGYVAVSRNSGYAYVAGYYAGTITVVDISNPAAPQVVGQSPSIPGLLSASHLTIVGSTLYVVSQNRNASLTNNDDGTGNSLTILDISNPTAPTIVGTPLHDSNVMFGPHGVAVSGNYAYVAAQGCLGQGKNKQPCPNPNVGDSFVVVDISNPVNPWIAASISNYNLPAPWTGSDALHHACSITVSGNYAYVTASYAHRLTIVDISDPLHPTIVGSVQDANSLPLPVDVAVKSGYAYVVNQVPNGSVTTPGSVTVVDVRTPTSPQVVGTVVDSNLNGAYRIRVWGNFAYVAAVSASATDVVDISDPANPRLIKPAFASTALLNHTVGVDLDPTSQYAISTSGWLSSENGTRTLYPPYPLQGGPTATGTVSTIALDPTPIGVTIKQNPASTTFATSATFAFVTSDPVSTVRCSLDGAAFGPCTTSTLQQYDSLALGTHTFQVEAIDAADRVATQSYSWTVAAWSAIDPTSSRPLDNFNRSNGTAGTNWTPIKSPTYAYMNVSASRAVNAVPVTPTSAYTWNYWSGTSPAGPTFGPDVEAYATVASYAAPPNSDTIRIGARVTIGSSSSGCSCSGYFVSISPAGAWTIIQIDNGGVDPNPLASGFTHALASGDKIGIRIVGSVVTALYNAGSGWVQVLSGDTSSKAIRYRGAGPVAIEFKASAIDDFGAGTIAAPANTMLPSVSGTVTVGQQLQADLGQWSGLPMPIPFFAYQWQDCDGAGNNCNPILNATGSSYTIQPSDGGDTLRVVVTGANSAGSSQAASAPTTVVPAAPVNTGLPSVSGTVAVGQQLQASAGTWSGSPSPTLTYQWLDCDTAAADCSPIQGATSSSYTVQDGDVDFALQVVVTGSNNVGSSQAVSVPTAVVPPQAQAPVSMASPSVSGTVAVGQQLQADVGTWSGTPSPSFTYQWQDCDGSGNNCSAIAGATASSYTIQASDVGSTLEVVVTGSNTAGSSQATSSPTTVVPQAPANTLAPSVSGTVAVGQQLQAMVGNWTGTPTPLFTYQWQDCDAGGNNCSSIQGATSSGYTIQANDVGFTLEVVVTGSNTAGSSQATSAPTTVVPQAPANTVAPQITGAVAVGQQLQVNAGTWSGTPSPTLTYQWQDCDSAGNNCSAIVGATASVYTVQTSDGGFTLKVVVTGSNTAGSSQATSAATALVAKPPTAQVVDNFNRTSGIGPRWTVITTKGFALMNVLANTAVDASNTAYAWNYWNAATFGPDVEAYMTVASYSGDTVRIGARVTPGPAYSGYFVWVSPTGVWSIIRIDNGGSPFTPPAEIPVTQTLASGDKIGIRIVGSVVTALHYTSSGGWTQVLSYDTSSDTTRYTSAGRVAIEFKTSTIDDFGAG